MECYMLRDLQQREHTLGRGYSFRWAGTEREQSGLSGDYPSYLSMVHFARQAQSERAITRKACQTIKTPCVFRSTNVER